MITSCETKSLDIKIDIGCERCKPISAINIAKQV